MSQIPSVGRIVHYYPGTNDRTLTDDRSSFNNNGAKVLPAIILQVFSETNGLANLMVFTANADAPLVRRYSVHSKEAISSHTYPEGFEPTYWDWPEIKRETPVIPIPPPTTDGASGDLTYKKFNEDNRA